MKNVLKLCIVFSLFGSLSAFAVDEYDISNENICGQINHDNDLWDSYNYYFNKAMDNDLTEEDKAEFFEVIKELNLYCTESDSFVKAVLNGFSNTQDPARCQAAVKGGAAGGCFTGAGFSQVTGGNKTVGCAVGAYAGAQAAYGTADSCKPKGN